MKYQRILMLMLLLVVSFSLMNCSSEEQRNAKKADEIISSMTLEQKAKLVIGTGMFFELPEGMESPFPDPFEGLEDEEYVEMVDRIRKYLPGAAGNTAAFEDLGITTQVMADGPAGLRVQPNRKGEDRTYYCTAFPIATVTASSWDTDLAYNIGEAMGKELLEYGGDILLAPALNIQRDVLCGRNFEYYSEDPLVSGKMAAAVVNGVQSNGVGTSIKHYVANNQETNRQTVNTIVSERAQRELYLKGFEIAVKESQPWTVMSSYNKVNGEYTSESHDLLTKVLRDDWGFEGYVVTDWGGGSDVVAQMKAGNDLVMPGSPAQFKRIIEAVESGELDESVLDTNIHRMLMIMFKTPKYKGYEYSDDPDLDAHALVTRQAATDGMVLLENKDSALPITSDIKNLAVFGTGSYEFIAGGTGSGDVNEAYTISLIQGLEEAGLTPHEELKSTYQKYIKDTRDSWPEPANFWEAWGRDSQPVEQMKVTSKLAKKMAGESDAALITISRNSGEGGDRKPVPGDFYLNETEKEMISNVSEAFQAEGKKVIVVLNIGGAIETMSWADIPDAVLLAWQPGQEAGNSVVDVLTGKVNPSGKLAVSFPVTYEETPTAENFPGYAIEGEKDDSDNLSGFSLRRRVPWEVVYEEDIFVGYRYYNTFEKPVAYEFGYGQSYTSFAYENLNVDQDEFTGKLTFSLEVTNTGEVAGREVVQIYASKPDGKLVKPVDELVAFDKTPMLQPGESATLSFELGTMDLASFDENRSLWIVEPGTYELKAGASSRDILLSDTFTVSEEIAGDKVTKAAAPQREFTRLKP